MESQALAKNRDDFQKDETIKGIKRIKIEIKNKTHEKL